MSNYQKKALPTAKWLNDLIDRKLEAFVMELEAGEKLSPMDFDRLVQFHHDKYKPKIDLTQIEWVDDWEDEDWWKNKAS